MRAIGRRHEFTHQLKRMLEDSTKSDRLTITTDPELIQSDLRRIGTQTEFTPVCEGLKGIALDDSRRKEGYEPKVIGYKFIIKP